jgi:hypothetical protein
MMTSTCKIDKAGDKVWRTREGQLHRDNGPAIEYTTGDKFWYQNGERHRTYGPAIELADGGAVWYKHGKLHRQDGPAIEYADGKHEWWIDGIKLTPAEFAANFIDEETALLWKMSGYCWPFDFGLSK